MGGAWVMLAYVRYDSSAGHRRPVEPADALRHRVNKGGLMFAPTESGTDNSPQPTALGVAVPSPTSPLVPGRW